MTDASEGRGEFRHDEFPGLSVGVGGEVYRWGKRLKTRIGTNGYEQVNLRTKGDQKTLSVHRLVATACLPMPTESRSLLQVNHLNGSKLDNRAENLEWCSRSQNMKHAAAKGLMAIGARNSGAKLSESDVVEIRTLLASGGLLQKEIAEMYGVSRRSISSIKTGFRWGKFDE